MWTSLRSRGTQRDRAHGWARGNNALVLKEVPVEAIARGGSPANGKGRPPASAFTTTFDRVSAAVATRGEVLIGWKVDGHVTVNPSVKDIPVALPSIEKIIVIAEPTDATENILRKCSVDVDNDSAVCPKRFCIDEDRAEE